MSQASPKVWRGDGGVEQALDTSHQKHDLVIRLPGGWSYQRLLVESMQFGRTERQ
jgi:hypothetical protein